MNNSNYIDLFNPGCTLKVVWTLENDLKDLSRKATTANIRRKWKKYERNSYIKYYQQTYKHIQIHPHKNDGSCGSSGKNVTGLNLGAPTQTLGNFSSRSSTEVTA